MHGHLRRVIEDILAATEMEAVERARSEISARRSEIARRIAL
jgi:GntR family hexuronate regulon transcriptional repressor